MSEPHQPREQPPQPSEDYAMASSSGTVAESSPAAEEPEDVDQPPVAAEPPAHSGAPDGAPDDVASALIALRDVRVVYKSRTGTVFKPVRVNAVAGVSLTVAAGETLGIVGESGSGKTTTARIMLGLEQPTSGHVYFKGRETGRRSARVRKEVGRVVSAVFQDPATALNPRMVIRDALRDPLDVHGVGSVREREGKVRDLIRLVGLPTSALQMLPTQLSGGQRQRVAIARALVLGPDVIVADEPTSALDVSVRAQILNLLADIKAQLGLAMVFISHDIQTVRYVSDRIVVMNKGKIVEQGPTERIFTDPQDPYTRSLLGAAPSLLAG